MNVAELATVADEVICLAADNIVARSSARIIAGAAREKERYHRILILVFIGHSLDDKVMLIITYKGEGISFSKHTFCFSPGESPSAFHSKGLF